MHQHAAPHPPPPGAATFICIYVRTYAVFYQLRVDHFVRQLFEKRREKYYIRLVADSKCLALFLANMPRFPCIPPREPPPSQL